MRWSVHTFLRRPTNYRRSIFPTVFLQVLVPERFGTLPEEGLDLEGYVASLQKSYLEEALDRTGGVQVKAAELLRMSYRSFRHYMQKHGIEGK